MDREGSEAYPWNSGWDSCPESWQTYYGGGAGSYPGASRYPCSYPPDPKVAMAAYAGAGFAGAWTTPIPSSTIGQQMVRLY